MSTALTLAELERYDPRAPSGRRERRFLCPFCGDDKPRGSAHRCLSLNVETERWLCHRCGARGRLRDSASVSHRLMTRLGAMTQAAFRLKRQRQAPAKEFDWQGAWQRSGSLAGSLGEGYALQRGIPTSLAQRAGVRYSSRWYGRPALLFPICDQGGRLVAVSGRFVHAPSGLKTMTGGSKSAGVFATPGALRSRTVAVVEGPMDALALALCGLPAVAMIGTSWSAWLPQALAHKSVLIATDADAAGDEAAARLICALAAFDCRARRLRPVGGKDWNDELLRLGHHRMQSHLSRCLAKSGTPTL